ncbi:MAG: hypothetical protein LBH24_01475, partial [Clostridiales bacterium]|nr:hypothetical protein [Clostridiales bacterium]
GAENSIVSATNLDVRDMTHATYARQAAFRVNLSEAPSYGDAPTNNVNRSGNIGGFIWINGRSVYTWNRITDTDRITIHALGKEKQLAFHIYLTHSEVNGAGYLKMDGSDVITFKQGMMLENGTVLDKDYTYKILAYKNVSLKDGGGVNSNNDLMPLDETAAPLRVSGLTKIGYSEDVIMDTLNFAVVFSEAITDTTLDVTANAAYAARISINGYSLQEINAANPDAVTARLDENKIIIDLKADTAMEDGVPLIDIARSASDQFVTLEKGLAANRGAGSKTLGGAYSQYYSFSEEIWHDYIQPPWNRPLQIIDAYYEIDSQDGGYTLFVKFDRSITDSWKPHLASDLAWIKSNMAQYYSPADIVKLTQYNIIEAMRQGIEINGKTVGELLEAQSAAGSGDVNTTVLLIMGAKGYNDVMSIKFGGVNAWDGAAQDLTVRFNDAFTTLYGDKLVAYNTVVYNAASRSVSIEGIGSDPSSSVPGRDRMPRYDDLPADAGGCSGAAAGTKAGLFYAAVLAAVCAAGLIKKKKAR